MDDVVNTVENRIEDAILGTMDNTITPRIELAVDQDTLLLIVVEVVKVC